MMDLDTGEVLWIGKGRTKADFSLFFQETDMLKAAVKQEQERYAQVKPCTVDAAYPKGQSVR